jgi:nanoRNase/pAp phosphatase (c-di-AMP/oligoRNAs hydrolase)
MDNNETKSSMEQLIDLSKNIAVIPSQVAGYDAFAAALGLFFGLKEKEKNVSLIYPDLVPEGFKDLITDGELTNPSLRELVVTIDYHDSPAQKVHYSTANDVLTLKISPVNSDFKAGNISAGIQTLGFDLIFVIGAQSKEDLGITYKNLENEFKAVKLVNLDHTGFNSRFGDINIVDPLMDNLSQLVLNFMVRAGFFISQKPAKALLRGISYRAVN